MPTPYCSMASGLIPACYTPSPPSPPRPALSIPSLPDAVLRFIFQALSDISFAHPDPVHSMLTFAPPTRTRTHSPPGSSSTPGAMLAATCSRLSAFYRLEFVTYLDFSSTPMSLVDSMQPHDLSRLLARFPRVSSIDLALNDALSRRILSALLVSGSLARAADLTVLHLANSSVLLDDCSVCDIVLACPHLSILNLSGCDTVGDVALKAISEGLPATLEELYADAPPDGPMPEPEWMLTDKGCVRLREMIRLRCLSLDNRDLLTDETFASLSGMWKMHTLSLSNTRVTLTALRQCLPQMQGLVRLHLASCPEMNAEALVAVLPESIEHLDLRATIDLDSNSASKLGDRLPNLISLEADCTSDFVDLSIFGRSCLERLEVLRLYCAWELPDEDAASCVKKMTSLRALRLVNSPLLSEKTMREASFLPRLERLDLDRACVTQDGAQILSEAITARHTLRFVGLWVEIDDEDFPDDIGTDLAGLEDALTNVGGGLDVLRA